MITEATVLGKASSLIGEILSPQPKGWVWKERNANANLCRNGHALLFNLGNIDFALTLFSVRHSIYALLSVARHVEVAWIQFSRLCFESFDWIKIFTVMQQFVFVTPGAKK